MGRKGENIYKRKDGRWEGRFQVNIPNTDRRKYVSVYAPSYREVKEKLYIAKLQKDGFLYKEKETFNTYVVRWLEENRECIKPPTYVKYKNIIKNHIMPHLGTMRVTDITTTVLQDYTERLLKTGKLKGEGGLSPKMVKDILTIIHSILIYYQKKKPEVKLHTIIPYPKSNKKDVDIFTRREQEIMEAYLLKNDSLINIGIWLSLYTGIRIGELCALTWNDIDLQRSTMYIRKTMQRIQRLDLSLDGVTILDRKLYGNRNPKTIVIITEPKTYKSKREIPLPDFIRAVLSEYVIEDDSAFFLTGSTKQYIEPRTMQNQFKTIIKQCNLPATNYHVVRHSFASRCVELGFELKTLSAILGHSKTSTTLDRYVHPSYDLKKDNMEKLLTLKQS